MVASSASIERVPDGWTPVPDGVFEFAKDRALEKLSPEGDDPVGPRLARYYDRSGNYAGASFVETAPNPVNDIVASDLHAVSLLSVTIGPGATRRFLEPGTVRDHLLASLGSVPDKDLADADAEDLAAVARLYEAVKASLRDPTSRTSDRWVTASKFCARKRPRLFPVRDSVVCNILGLTRL